MSSGNAAKGVLWAGYGVGSSRSRGNGSAGGVVLVHGAGWMTVSYASHVHARVAIRDGSSRRFAGFPWVRHEACIGRQCFGRCTDGEVKRGGEQPGVGDQSDAGNRLQACSGCGPHVVLLKGRCNIDIQGGQFVDERRNQHLQPCTDGTTRGCWVRAYNWCTQRVSACCRMSSSASRCARRCCTSV